MKAETFPTSNGVQNDSPWVQAELSGFPPLDEAQNTVVKLPDLDTPKSNKADFGNDGFNFNNAGAENVGFTTREQRITDGKEKVDRFKAGVKTGFGRMMKGLRKGLSEGFYISVSRGAEVPGQVARGAKAAGEGAREAGSAVARGAKTAGEAVVTGAKNAGEAMAEKGKNAWTAAKEKSGDLFDKGSNFIKQAAAEAAKRRDDRREERKRRRDAAENTRSEVNAQLRNRATDRAERQKGREFQANTLDNEDRRSDILTDSAREEIKYNSERMNMLLRQSEEVDKHIEAANKDKLNAEEELAQATENFNKAQEELKNNPGDTALQIALSVAENAKNYTEQKLNSVSLRIDTLNAIKDVLFTEINDRLSEIKKDQEAIDKEATMASDRKARRKAARKEAFGDRIEGMKDRLVGVAINTPAFVRKLGSGIKGRAQQKAEAFLQQSRSSDDFDPTVYYKQ